MILKAITPWNTTSPIDIPGCVFYMNFNEITNGSYILDRVSGRAGSITGNPLPEYRDGRFGSCLGFYGSSGLIGTAGSIINVVFGSPLPIDRNGNITLSMWVSPGNHTTNHTDAGHFFSTNDYSFWVRKNSATGSMSINFNTQSGPNAGSYSDRSKSIPCTNNQWCHIVVTKADAIDGGSAYFYSNNILRTSQGFCGSISSRTNRFTIGAFIGYPQFQNLACSGLIDEIALYNRVLSDQEINQLYQGGYSKFANIKNEW